MSWEDLVEGFDETLAYWQHMFQAVEERLLANDRKMVQEHARRADLDQLDVRTAFNPGDMVLLRSPRPGKLKVRAVGPYTFLHYVGWRGTNAMIQGRSGQTLTVSVANLRPVHADMVVVHMRQA